MWHKAEVVDFTSRSSTKLALALEMLDVPPGRWLVLHFNKLSDLRYVQIMVREAAYEAGWYDGIDEKDRPNVTMFETRSFRKVHEHILKIYRRVNPEPTRGSKEKKNA